MKSVAEFKLGTEILKKLYLNEVVEGHTSQDLSKILDENPKLVVALNHGPVSGAIAGILGFNMMLEKHGGHERKPFGLTWRTFYDLPISKHFAKYVTQVDKGVNFDEANALLSNGGFTDCFIMPEGELCNFGDGEYVHPFLSPRFVELAILNECPVLVGVHLGSEEWARPVAVNDQFKPLFNWLPKNMKRRFNQTGTVSVPKMIKKKLNSLYMSFFLYEPGFTADELSDDKAERTHQLKYEAEQVRARMQTMIGELQMQRSGQLKSA